MRAIALASHEARHILAASKQPAVVELVDTRPISMSSKQAFSEMHDYLRQVIADAQSQSQSRATASSSSWFLNVESWCLLFYDMQYVQLSNLLWKSSSDASGPAYIYCFDQTRMGRMLFFIFYFIAKRSLLTHSCCSIYNYYCNICHCDGVTSGDQFQVQANQINHNLIV